MALAQVTEEDPFTGLPERERIWRDSQATCIFITTTSIRWAGRSALSGRGARRRRRWRPTRALQTPMAAALTRRPGARCWPTRGDLWAAIAQLCGVSAAPLAEG